MLKKLLGYIYIYICILYKTYQLGRLFGAETRYQIIDLFIIYFYFLSLIVKLF